MKSLPPALTTLLETGALGQHSDRSLLERFVASRDDSAFEALVQRHGPMVWGVCLRILRDPHDAEDAFQATFLVLACKAASLAHRELLTGWLHGVAFRTATRARAVRSRRKARETRLAAARAELARPTRGAWDDLLPVLDRELGCLPARYQIPLILCDLEGKTHKEASEALGWPIGTVSGRLSRARALLARRLSRHRLAMTPVVLGAYFADQAAAATCPPARLGRATARIAALLGTGRTPSNVAGSAAVSLTRGVLKAMLVSKLASITAGMLLIAALSTGLAASHSWAQPTAPAATAGDPTRRAQKPGATGSESTRARASLEAQRRETRESVKTTLLELVALRDALKKELDGVQNDYIRLRSTRVPNRDPKMVAAKKRLSNLTSEFNRVLDAMKSLHILLDSSLAPHEISRPIDLGGKAAEVQ